MTVLKFEHKSFLKSLTARPGVYRMLGAGKEILYVGKAKNLKRRVSSYFTRSLNLRIQRMVMQIESIEITITNSEAEALILENNLIKSLKPKYNVLLRDDKSYPYLLLSDHPFPRLSFHRGARNKKGRYFGPYASSSAVRETLHLLQKVFPVRQCEDSFYKNRSRPCLQYQIKRCSGPCVNLISRENYARDVQNTQRFLEGKASQLIDELSDMMTIASRNLDFEQAAQYRDQMISLRKIQEKQYVSGEKGDVDIVACVMQSGRACIQLFTIRAGRNLGNRVFFPRMTRETPEKQVVGAFLAQHYLEKLSPSEIIVSEKPEGKELLEQVLSKQNEKKVMIRTSVRGERLRWLQLAMQNAEAALKARISVHSGIEESYLQLQEALGLGELPQSMECYDISHTQGERTVASCVVFDQHGPARQLYRRFNIKTAAAGDDYAALQEAIQRRYKRIQQEDGQVPDLILIDGGKGQLSSVAEILTELGVSGVDLVGIAKGPERKPGMEQLFLNGQRQPLILPADSVALHLLQQIRDEAHRFAITGHRKQRAKARKQSVLEEIEGVGPKRRRDLLRHFGGLQELIRAGAEDIAGVEGISKQLANRIYQHLHGN